MKKILLIQISLLFFWACGGPAQPASEPVSEAKTPTTMESPGTAPEAMTAATMENMDMEGATVEMLEGLYLLGSMDQSWAVLIEHGSDGWTASAMEKEAALPAAGKLLADPAGAGMKPFQQFAVDEAAGTFTSDWGKGRFETSGANVIMVFEEKPGLFHPETAETDAALYLKKQR